MEPVYGTRAIAPFRIKSMSFLTDQVKVVWVEPTNEEDDVTT